MVPWLFFEADFVRQDMESFSLDVVGKLRLLTWLIICAAACRLCAPSMLLATHTPRHGIKYCRRNKAGVHSPRGRKFRQLKQPINIHFEPLPGRHQLCW